MVDPAVAEWDYARDDAWMSWVQNSQDHPKRQTLYAAGPTGKPIRIAGPSAGNGSIDHHALVYWNSVDGDSDLYWYDLERNHGGTFSRAVNTNAAEYAPQLSGEWMLFSREHYDDMEIMLYNLRTRMVIELDRGYNGGAWLEPGQLTCGHATWSRERNGTAGSDVFVYDIASHRTVRMPRGAAIQQSPSVTADGTVYFIRMPALSECPHRQELVKYPPGGPSTVLYRFPPQAPVGPTYVDERPDGSRHIYFSTDQCGGPGRWAADVYEIVDP